MIFRSRPSVLLACLSIAYLTNWQLPKGYGDLLTPGLYRTSIQIDQHTKPLLREIGYDDQQIEDLGMLGPVHWADPSVGGEP